MYISPYENLKIGTTFALWSHMTGVLEKLTGCSSASVKNVRSSKPRQKKSSPIPTSNVNTLRRIYENGRLDFDIKTGFLEEVTPLIILKQNILSTTRERELEAIRS